MPSLTTICYYAMYVIGEVESNWNWTSVYYVDPITIGMMQWYGERAAGVLLRLKNELPSAYNQLASSLRSNLDTYGDGNYWNSRYLTQTEGNSIVAAFTSRESHAIQENQAIADFENYITILQGWGMSTANPKPLIFTMAMYHQSPARAGRVIASAGGNATLARVYDVCMGDSVLGRYTNRYNTVYSRLNAWDGESDPPDFGQNGSESAGGNSSGDGSITGSIDYIIRSGDMLVVYGSGDFLGGAILYLQADGVWSGETAADNWIIAQGDNLVMYGNGGFSDGIIFYPTTEGTWIPSKEIKFTGGNTGGGSGNAQAVVDLYKSWVGRFAYSQGPGRLTPLESGYGDCSSTVWAAYHIAAGINVGTWTGEQDTLGTEIATGYGTDLPLDSMYPGDLVIFWWDSASGDSDHVEMYIGDGQLCGHGGPGYGPTIKDAQSRAHRAAKWRVRRYM